jgi:hypothetical protein
MHHYIVPNHSGHIRVRFTTEDLIDAFFIAWQRGEAKRRHGIQSRKVDRKTDDLTMDVYGSLAEMAVSEVFNTSSPAIEYLYGDSNQPDNTLPNGQTIETKYTNERDRRFILGYTDPERFTADFGVLLWPAKDREVEDPFNVDMDIVGVISRERLRQVAYVTNLGYNAVLVVDLADMRSPQLLLQHLKVA